MKKILHVDSEPHIGCLLKLYLSENSTFEIINKYSVADAKFWLKNNVPDLIISEVLFPHNSSEGFDFCEFVRNNVLLKDVPLIFLSCKSDLSDKFKSITVGADNFISKPFEPSKLLEVVEVSVS